VVTRVFRCAYHYRTCPRLGRTAAQGGGPTLRAPAGRRSPLASELKPRAILRADTLQRARASGGARRRPAPPGALGGQHPYEW